MPNPFRTHPTLTTVGLTAMLFGAVIYVPPMFDTPKEAVQRGQRECSWAIQTKSSIESKCNLFVAKAEKYLQDAEPWVAGDVWMQIAEFRLIQSDVAASKRACHQAMTSYRQLGPSIASLSNAANAKRICDALFAKYGS